MSGMSFVLCFNIVVLLLRTVVAVDVNGKAFVATEMIFKWTLS